MDCEAIQIKKPGYSEVIGSLLTLNEQALSASAMHGLGARGLRRFLRPPFGGGGAESGIRARGPNRVIGHVAVIG